MRVIIVIYTIISLLGCTSYNSSAPSDYQTGEYFYIQPDWIKNNQAELTDRLVEVIKNNHPNTAKWFPLVQITNIDIETETASWRNAPELTKVLNDLLGNTLSKIYTSTENNVSLKLDLKIRKASTEMNKVLYAMQFPYGVACFSTLMLVCPVAGEQIVVTEGTFTKNSVTQFTISGAGATTAVAISPYAADSSQWLDEANSKALIAALSQLTDKFVSHVEKNGI